MQRILCRAILWLTLAWSGSSFAMELQRLAPTVCGAGSEVHLLGRGFGPKPGNLVVVIQRQGEPDRIHMRALRWSDTDILVRIPDAVTSGVYAITIVGTRIPPVQSRGQLFSVAPRLREEYDQAYRAREDEPRPSFRIRPEMVPTLRDQGNGTGGFSVAPELVTPDPVTNERTCADPALESLKVLDPARNPDGSYRFQLGIQIGNVGGFPFEADRKQTRLTVRQGERLLHSATWTAPTPRRVELRPGHTQRVSIPVSRVTVKEAARDLRAEISVINQAGDGPRSRDCNVSNNQRVLDSASLRRALMITR